MKKGVWIAIIVVVIAAVAFFIGNRIEPQDVIKIGAILPLTGDAALYGKNAKEGIDLATQEINQKGGLLRKQVKIFYEDSQALPKIGVNAYKKLTTVDKVVAVVGGISSSVTLAFAPLAEKDQVVVFSPAATSPAISEAGKYIFRNWVSDAYEAKVMANGAKTRLNISKLAILYINNDYGIGLRDEITTIFARNGGNIVVNEAFAQNETNFRTILTKVKAECDKGNCDATYMIAYPDEFIRILNQAKELKVDSRFLATSAFKDNMILKNALGASEGVIFPYPYPPDESYSQTRAFHDAFVEMFEKEPGIVADTAYDALMMICLAIQNQDSCKRISIQKGLEDFTEQNKYKGASGEYCFDKNGDIEKLMTLMTVMNGSFIEYKGD